MCKRYDNIREVENMVISLCNGLEKDFFIQDVADEITDFDGMGYLIVTKYYSDKSNLYGSLMQHAKCKRGYEYAKAKRREIKRTNAQDSRPRTQ